MKIGIASDHRGFKLKQKLTKYLMKKHYDVIDYGTDSTDPVDYPDYVLKLGEGIRTNAIDLGVVICGTGIGVSIACNKIRGLRCAKLNNIREARLSKLDNNANVMAIAGNTNILRAKDILDVFLKTPFSNEERHIRRIDKITKMEEENL
jgi:ribose 5-phosphate isomerase B